MQREDTADILHCVLAAGDISSIENTFITVCLCATLLNKNYKIVFHLQIYNLENASRRIN